MFLLVVYYNNIKNPLIVYQVYIGLLVKFKYNEAYKTIMVNYNLNDIAPYFAVGVGFCGLYAVSKAIYYSTKIKNSIVKHKHRDEKGKLIRKDTLYNNKDPLEDRLK